MGDSASSSDDELPPINEKDAASLRKLRDESDCEENCGWWTGEDPRLWTSFGEKSVTVVDGRVTIVSLIHCSTLAALPAAIGELDALTELIFFDCSSLAALPDAIGELGALTKLTLTGASLTALPDVIGKLKALKTLELDGCSSLAALPDAIGELGALTNLDLRYCNSLAVLPAAIGELGALTELNLSNCSSLVELPVAIGELGALRELDLSGCSSLTALPDSIGGLDTLRTLDLSGCKILKKIPDAVAAREGLTLELPAQLVAGPLGEDFAALRKMRDDDASGVLKEFFGDGEDPSEWVYPKIRNSEKMPCVTVADGRVTKLDLYQCKVVALPATIGELKALKTLDLRGCSKLAALPVAICQLGALKTLDLAGCSSLETLPDAISERKGLTVYLPIQLMADGPLLEDFAALRTLRDDNANGNGLREEWDGEDPREWKYAWGDVVTVNDGRVSDFNFSHCNDLRVLPAAIGGLGALTSFRLSFCHSLTELPAAIGELKALKSLELRSCDALANVSDAIGGLRALETLQLSSERLSAVPYTIGELCALKSLDLSSSERLTELPDSIGKLGSLTTLNLNMCSTLATLPDAVGELKELRALDLSGCSSLAFPPEETHGDLTKLKRYLAAGRLFDGSVSTLVEAQDTTKALLFDRVINNERFAKILRKAVRKNPTIANWTNAKGQRAIDAACLECRQAMQKALYFLGRYEIADGPPEHRSATSLVVRAIDAAADYGRLFDQFDKDGSGVLDTDELIALATHLGTTVETFKLADGESYTRDAFVARFGKERKVVIKIFQIEEQWRNEKKARDELGLDAQFVVQTIEAPTDDKFAKALGESALFKRKDRFGEGIGSHAIVMDAADRNLFQIYQSERPDLNKVRVLMRETMECVQHLHEKGLVHGDIKMLNVVRLALDHRLRLIDLDAAAKISSFGGDVSYVGSKFSSAVLPPECFAKLDADQAKKFEAYFEGVEAELREKIAPKTKQGVSYVVKTFSLTKDGAQKDDLPYELVEASQAVDYWSLGALLFQLVAGEPLVPSNRDDDCVDGNAMAALASWNDDAGKRRLAVIKDPAARDLASKLLVRDPDERSEFSIAETLARHPFFHSESPNEEMKKALEGIKEQQKKDSEKLDAIKADTSAILELSKENKFELQRTREVLLKAAFEATEVTTPTTFVVLTEELKDLTPEQKTWIETNLTLEDDGSGAKFKGKELEWYADLKARFEDGKSWADQLAQFKPEEAVKPKNFKSLIQGALDHFLPTTTLYFYLVDELTGKPVRGGGYPIVIKEPAEKLAKLLPVMQVGLHAMSAYNGVAGLVQMFGYPVPKVPEKWREAAKDSVDLLKQESSVAAFGAINEKVKDKDQASQTVRGVSLRELEEFFKKEDPGKKYAGLRRVGDPNEGTAIWTCLEGDKFEQALTERANQWRAAHADDGEVERSIGVKAAPEVASSREVGPEAASPKLLDTAATDRTPSVAQGQNAAVNEELLKALAKANGGTTTAGTCNNSCHCIVA